MLVNFRKFVSLDGKRRRLLLAAWVALGRARLDLERKPFKKLVSGLESAPASEDQGESITDAEPEVALIGWAIRAASGRTPWQSTCLVQVLAAQRMLKERGLPGEFCLGAARDESLGQGIHAHAWLLSGGVFITGENGHEKYRVLARYRWE